MNNISLFILILFYVLIFLKYHSLISKYLNINDIPDKKRKLHKSKIPLTGGIFFLPPILLLILIDQNNPLTFNISLLFFFIIFFLIGMADDILDIPAQNKFVYIFLICLLFLSISNKFIFTEFKILFTDDYHFSKKINTFFLTAIFISSFAIVLNMFDGINGLVGIFTLFVLLTLKINYLNFEIIFLILLLFIFFNIKNIFFLGSAGNMILSLLISLSLIENYNKIYEVDLLYISAILFFPFMDATRLFFHRIILKKNPFSADRMHLHHYLVDSKIFKKFTYLIYIGLFALTSILLSLKVNSFIIISVNLTLYILLLVCLKKN